ncbi:MAG: hypothetical protein L0Z73_11000 [Gammaproteobacteria bacterium]|nr:hypothetical protein [Gammaproteobacteria bacterium]
MRRLKLARIVEDIPVSKIGSASQGYVEVKGKTFIESGLPIYVPMLKIPCVWYRYEAFREHEDHESTEPDLKESIQRIYIKDLTGICAVDPREAEIEPKKTRELVEFGVLHRFRWLGVGEHVYVAGWLKTLHPMPEVSDKLPGSCTGLIKQQELNLRYGQLKKPLNVIIKPPEDDLPFFITTGFRRLTAKRARLEAVAWSFAFGIVGVILPYVVGVMYGS